MTGIRKWIKGIVLFFTENSFYAQKEENGSFLAPKTTLLNFSVNFLFRVLWNGIW